MIGPRLRRIAALAAVLAVAGTALVACGDDDGAGVDYLVDARVDTYNANTSDGYADGALMALTRVLPGFSYIGPDGQTVSDLDVGTATLVESSPMKVEYKFAPEAVYSDGHKMTCDDVLLAATAMGGRVRGFDAATHAGYADIDHVDCAPGADTATVTFSRDSAYRDWLGLFGAGTLLPAHVVGALAGVPDVGAAIRDGKKKQLAAIARAWNTGFALTPGDDVDPKVFVSSGPYKVESYTTDGGLRLVANDKWWGTPPTLQNITVWPRGTDGKRALDDGAVDVVDTVDVADADAMTGRESSTPADDRRAARDPAALAVTGLVFSGKGVAADPKMRKALASCTPRDRLARTYGANGVVWNLRSASPADSLGPSLNAQYGRRYPRADTRRARALLDQRATGSDGRRRAAVIRIGYPGGSTVDQGVVSAITASCKAAGITVKDVATPEFSITDLGSKADAVLMSGDTLAASGTASGLPGVYSLYRGDPLNVAGFADGAVKKAIDDLAGTTSDSARLPLLRTIDSHAWDDLPSIPLFGTVRAREGVDVARVVPGLGRSGTGWNMDRWGDER